jgi:hypothetical protein
MAPQIASWLLTQDEIPSLLQSVGATSHTPKQPSTFGTVMYETEYSLGLTQLYVYCIIRLLLAASFGLTRPPSGQYLQ